VDILKILKQGESETVEYKLGFNKEVIETVVAFSNTRGGVIIIGVNNDGEVKGVKIGTETLKDWGNQISQNTEPKVIPDIRMIEVKHKVVAIIEIKEFPLKPVSTRGRSLRRVQNSNRQMSPQEIAHMHLASTGSSWDALSAENVSLNDLDLTKVQEFIISATATGRKNFGHTPDPIGILEKLELVKSGVPTWASVLIFGKTQPVRILIDKTQLELTHAGIEEERVLYSKTVTAKTHLFLPDILAYLQRETELTRATLVEILKATGRLSEFTVNPQAFMTEAARRINRALHEMVVDGIKYEEIQGQCYEMRLFEETEIQEYLNRLYAIQSRDDRTPYDYIHYESEIERDVAAKLDNDENVRFFCKLPRWFVIPTPLGNYNPDWAIATENGEKLYLVRETKSTHDSDKRRDTENRKIDCGKAHFKALGVDFKVATGIHEVLAG